MPPAHHHQDIAALQDRLTRLSQASLNINESLDLDDVFRKVLDSARSLTGARYGVITTINDAGHKNAFLSSGTTPEEHRQLAEMPERHQLFGYLSRLSAPMRVDDFQSHTRSLGMPEFTPLLPVRAFLGAPIRYRGASMGHIYLAKPDGAPEFTQEDEETLAMFASHAALAIANARRYRDEQRARNDLEALVSLSPLGVLVFDARTGDLLLVNEEARRIGGGQHEPADYIHELLRSTTLRRADGREIALGEHPIAQIIRSGESVRAEEVSLVLPDGRSVPALLNVASLSSADGEVESVVVTLQDMTPLDELERLRAEFLGLVSHELRTPLTSIKGAATTLLTTLDSLDPAELLQFIRIIDAQADHMRELIGALLDVVRIETGTLSVTPEPVAVARLVDEARTMFLSGADRNRVEIDLAPDLPRVMADRRRISQVLTNLLSNADRHSRESPGILITAAQEEFHVAISVADRGAGVPAERLPHLFRKFYGAEGPAAGWEFGGTGLGLAICKGIVEAHGGRIWAESDGLGLGSSLTFTLPVATEPDTPDRMGHPRLPSLNRGTAAPTVRILAVDDDPHTLRYVRDTLSQAGYTPIVTANPADVQQLIETNRPDLMLLDLMLPGIDGIELMQGILQTTNIPIIFLSAYGQDDYVTRAFRSGAADYVVKPFSPTELVARIQAALHKWAGLPITEPTEPYVLANLTINYAERKVFVSGRQVALTATEYDLLAQLSINYERPLTHDQLLRRVWGLGHSGDARLVRTVVTRLRRKLGDNAHQPAYIFTQPGVGYRMPQPDRPQPDGPPPDDPLPKPESTDGRRKDSGRG